MIMSGDSKKLIAINYFGSKFTFADEIISYFPEHDHFIDVFAGSFAVILNKEYSKIDTANDINGDVTNFFSVLRDYRDELIQSLQLTPVSRDEFKTAWNILEDDDNIERARKFFIRARQSIYGLGSQHQNKGWIGVKSMSRTHHAYGVSKWLNSIEKLPEIAEKLSKIQIECQDFSKIIKVLDYKNAFFYCDPPYPHESRSGNNDYKHELSDDRHMELSELLYDIHGKAMISSYECNLMHDLYESKGWQKIKLKTKRNNIRNQAVQEVIYINYPVPEKIIQGKLEL
jgi:DNA adenine methylase